MLSFPATARIYVFHEAVSFHRQREGLAAIVRQRMGKDPLSGAYFVFRSRRKKSLRILYFDGSGIWLCTKYLTEGCLGRSWPQGPGDYSPLMVSHLQQLLWGNVASAHAPLQWRCLA